jgi:hypothetical protein
MLELKDEDGDTLWWVTTEEAEELGEWLDTHWCNLPDDLKYLMNALKEHGAQSR